MATTINSYSVSLGLDASSFINNANLSRSEFRQLTKDIEAARTPAEQFALEQNRLTKALQNGNIDSATYNRLLESKRKSLLGATAAINPMTVALTATAAAMTAAAVGAAAFVKGIHDVQTQIDDTADAANRLGVSYTDLKTLQFGFAESAGIKPDAVAEGIKKMQIAMARAVEGDQATRAAFAKLGLDAGQLMTMGPQQAVMKIADGMQNIGSHAERLKLSMEIFGKSGADLASTLGQGSEHLRQSMDFASRWLGLTEQQVAMVGASNDAWDRVGIVVEGITTKVAAEMAPAIELVTGSLLDAAGGASAVDASIRGVVDTSVAFVGHLIDAYEVLEKIAEVSTMFTAMNFSFVKTVGTKDEAFHWDTAKKALEQLEKNRAAAREAAAETLAKREDAWQATRAEADERKRMESAQKVAERAAEEEERQRIRLREQERRDTESALRAAEQVFEEERQRQKKMQDDVAKGPGAGIQSGSAEYVRYMAQQTNRTIAQNIGGVEAKPSEEQLVEEARKQTEIARRQEEKLLQLIEKIQGVKDAVEDNGFEAVG